MVDVAEINSQVGIRVELERAQRCVTAVLGRLEEHRDDASVEVFMDLLDQAIESIVEVYNQL